MKAIELLNQHLDDIVTLGGRQYPKEKVMRVYEKLNPPIPAGTFYDGERVRGRISPSGSVDFKTFYPETDWTYNSPAEQGIQSSSPPPRKELIQMQRSFNNLLSSPQGRVVFTNTPLSEHRAKAYEKIGFSPVDENGTQILDNRRFQNIPAIKDIYSLSAPSNQMSLAPRSTPLPFPDDYPNPVEYGLPLVRTGNRTDINEAVEFLENHFLNTSDPNWGQTHNNLVDYLANLRPFYS